MRVIEGDCLSVMPTLDAESVDSIVCDPPYGLKFMGKEWDHGIPGVPFWEAAKRVAKPGAYLLAFGGTRTHHRLACAIEDAGWEIRDCLMWLHGQGFPKGKAQLKPAWEPIIMARKKGTLQPLNIDGCRIEGAAGDGKWSAEYGHTGPQKRTVFDSGFSGGTRSDAGNGNVGRWPANLILDEIAGQLLDDQSGELLGAGNTKPSSAPEGMFSDASPPRYRNYYANSGGGASRFFYTAKASRSEREAGLEQQPQRMGGTMKGGDIVSDGRTAPKTGRRLVGNNHPTVKPLDLMQWLCRLVTPKGGLILDPFCGSGTTGRAAVAEGFQFIGIEKSPEYAAIARARITEYAPLFGDVA